uniref:Uncharacterized protein n=1 Tax=Siphoviridae sp. ctNLX12 TaxID=2825469 RepID=A0A8S5UDE4_9CAUD|nr:MAG TPA: hypothetical protein [Siphoviridae sp. ctNLX12]
MCRVVYIQNRQLDLQKMKFRASFTKQDFAENLRKLMNYALNAERILRSL